MFRTRAKLSGSDLLTQLDIKFPIDGVRSPKKEKEYQVIVVKYRTLPRHLGGQHVVCNKFISQTSEFVPKNISTWHYSFVIYARGVGCCTPPFFVY